MIAIPSSRTLRRLGVAAGAPIVALAGVVTYSHGATMRDIAAHEDRVVALADEVGPVAFDATLEVPAPVARFVAATFEDPAVVVAETATFDFEGDFRRPLTDGFDPVAGSQVVATNEPALVFSATTTMVPGLWAVAYDAYAEGQMEMKAKVESTITVVDERETPELNETSLQRWLLMSPLYPSALLPGGQVTWEAVDDERARATVNAHGYEASLVFTFGDDGLITRVDAEEDGDLTTSYHGSGEHFAVGDYERVDGVMIPHTFTVARAAAGGLYPFLEADLTRIEFGSVEPSADLAQAGDEAG